MRVVLLGTAAGGGFPQWNCACRLCAACRAGDPSVPPRTQDCLAVSANDTDWYLINASPDLRAQILATPRLAAGPRIRQTPLRGVLLTDAELDHTLGLLLLREGGGTRVFAPPAVLSALADDLPVSGAVSCYADWSWESEVDFPGLVVAALAVSDKKPRYAAGSPMDGPWVVAYRISDPATGGTLVYAPCLREWSAAFDDFVSGADVALVDGTFYSPDELAGAGTNRRDQRVMGHVPIAGEDGSLARAAGHVGTRWCYTHLNNTNPVLDDRSPEAAAVRAAGVNVPRDGTELLV